MTSGAFTHYAAGFLLCEDQVLLIRKTRPSWQAGLLNGLGGRIEDGEQPVEAMRREFREEADLDVAGWVPFASVTGDWWGRVDFFRARVTRDVFDSVELFDRGEGALEVHTCASAISAGVVSNLAWLLPLAFYTGENYAPVDVTELPPVTAGAQTAGVAKSSR